MRILVQKKFCKRRNSYGMAVLQSKSTWKLGWRLCHLKQNPSAVLASRFNVPQGMTDPNEILQHLLNTNQVTQQQVNQIMNMRNNPQIQQMFDMK